MRRAEQALRGDPPHAGGVSRRPAALRKCMRDADGAAHLVLSVVVIRVEVGLYGEVPRAHVESRIGGVVDVGTSEPGAAGADTSGITWVHEIVARREHWTILGSTFDVGASTSGSSVWVDTRDDLG